MDKELLKEYHARNVRWSDKSLSQLSFFNNLLLSLSLGFLSVGFKNNVVQSVQFATTNIDWPLTLSNLSMLFTFLSICAGLIVGISRLWDFRITRHINQTRQRVYEHSDEKLDETSPEKFPCFKRFAIYKTLLFKDYPRITIDESISFKMNTDAEKQKLKDSFRELRVISFNIGLDTWCITKFQAISMGIGVTLYVFARFA